MHWLKSATVHVQPRPNEEHGCSDRSDKSCQDASTKEQEDVCQWRGGAWNVQMNSTRDDEECADNDDETGKLSHRMEDTVTRVQSHNVIAAGNGRETGTEFRIVTFPVVLEDERKNCDRRQQNSKRRKKRWMRFDRRDGHIRELPSRFNSRSSKSE